MLLNALGSGVGVLEVNAGLREEEEVGTVSLNKAAVHVLLGVGVGVSGVG